MRAETLCEIRRRIEHRATESGRYRVVCARTGVSPVPVSGLRFPSRAVACAAARETTVYRDRLRALDPRMRYHELVVHEEPTVSDIKHDPVSTAFWALVG